MYCSTRVHHLDLSQSELLLASLETSLYLHSLAQPLAFLHISTISSAFLVQPPGRSIFLFLRKLVDFFPRTHPHLIFRRGCRSRRSLTSSPSSACVRSPFVHRLLRQLVPALLLLAATTTTPICDDAHLLQKQKIDNRCGGFIGRKILLPATSALASVSVPSITFEAFACFASMNLLLCLFDSPPRLVCSPLRILFGPCLAHGSIHPQSSLASAR